MPAPWLSLALAAAAVAAAGVYLLARRPKPVVYANPREERLTRTLARVVGCSHAQALAAVRREVALAPKQSDATLLKRAAYHYRLELPERFGSVYRDAAPG